MITRARLLLYVRSVGFLATLIALHTGVTGFMSFIFRARHNAPSLAFWNVLDPRMAHGMASTLLLLVCLYTFLDGRLVAWAIGRALPEGDSHGCPSCGYDLAGETSPGCSECGWGREGTPTRGEGDSA